MSEPRSRYRMFRSLDTSQAPDEELGYAFHPLDTSKAPSGEELLRYVREKNLKDALKALVLGTDPNYQDKKSENTALHIAVIVKSEVLVKLLIVFDANLTLTNKNNETALDLAEDECAYHIADDIRNVLALREELEKDPPKDPPTSDCADGVDKPDLMLSLDGGGIRGLVFVQVLLEMEKRRKQRYPDKVGKATPTLLECFNWVTGNSTGGIAALAFAAAKDSPLQGRRMYFDMKDQVLGGYPPIPNETVDAVFQQVFGQSTIMSNIKHRKVSVMTTLATQSPPILHIMSNYGEALDGRDSPSTRLVWTAARATSSVPLYFHPQDDRYLDGGLIANNPTTDAIMDMFEFCQSQHKTPNLKLVLSLGCGFSPSKKIDSVDFKRSCFANCIGCTVDCVFGRCPCSAKWGGMIQAFCLGLCNLGASRDVVDIIESQITQPNGQVVRRAKFICENLGAKFFRIDPEIGNVNFLTTDNETLIDMLYTVVYYTLKNCRTEVDPVLDVIYGQ